MYSASQYVKEEVYTALHRVHQGYMRAVVPLLAAACAPGAIPPQWDVLQRYDATHNYTAALAGLLSALGLAQQVPTSPIAASGQPQPIPTVVQRPAPVPARPILPRERFPERLERLGFAAAMGRDPQTGKEVAFIRSPLCPVPAGPFLMGSDPRQDSQTQDDEKPQITVELPAYQIGKFPVTVAEYACFVAAGHAAPQKGSYGVEWQVQLQRLDHPVTSVTWRDARDYAVWLAQLTGQPWALPSEAEWEKAARWDAQGNGGRGVARIYPWGDRFDSARCNTSESGIKMTTAVGTYGPENPADGRPTPERDGSSPYGTQEMAGNVWEWTRTIYDAQAYRKKTFREDDNSTENRVLRGGAWNDGSRLARAACRLGDNPDYFDGDWGFRVVLRAAAGS